MQDEIWQAIFRPRYGPRRRPGRVALFQGSWQPHDQSKGHQDMVSEADRNVELFIREAIASSYPDDGVVGEEHAATSSRSGYTWVLDPIDGTANFVERNPVVDRRHRHRSRRRSGGGRDPGPCWARHPRAPRRGRLPEWCTDACQP